MADELGTTLPRLADALHDVGARLGEISAELHALTPGAIAAATPTTATTPAAWRTAAARQQHGGQPGAGSSAAAEPVAQLPADGTAPQANLGQQHVGAGDSQPADPVAPEPAGHLSAASVTSLATPGAPEPAGHSGVTANPIGVAAGYFTPAPATNPTAQPVPTQHPGFVQQSGGPAQPGGQPGEENRPWDAQQSVWHGSPERPQSTLWQWLSRDGAGSRILAWAGAVVTLAGVVLLLILAIQRGYLGPLPRVLLGVGLGLALASIGAWVHRNPTARTGAYALAATGSAVLYLDVVAATSLYGFFPPWTGLLNGLAVTAAGVALAKAWNSQLFAVFMVVCCAVSAPIITQGFDTLLLSFLLVLLLATTPVQLATRWYGLMIAGGLPPVVVGLIVVALADDTADATTTAMLAGITSVVIGALTTITAIRRPDDQFTLAMLCLAPVPGMFAAILLPRAGAAILTAALAVLLLLVWVLGYLASLPRAFALAAGGLASLAFLQATAIAFDGNGRAIAFLAEALILTMLAVRLRLKVALVPAALFAMVGLVMGLVDAVRPDRLLLPGNTDVATAVTLGLTGILVAAVAITLCWAGFRLDVVPDGPHGWVPAGLLALYGSTATLLSVGLLISQDRDGFLLGHVFVTVSWTVAALVLLLRGIDSVPFRVAGLSLVVAALTKLVLFDLSSLDGMARVMAFLVAGLVLLAAGARYARLVATRARS